MVGENGREFYITEKSTLEIDIGREKRVDDPNYFNLSDQNTMSKKHASICWDEMENGFFIRNYSKNKVSKFDLLNNGNNSFQIQVDSYELTCKDNPHRLENMTLIVISKIKVYFLLPRGISDEAAA